MVPSSIRFLALLAGCVVVCPGLSLAAQTPAADPAVHPITLPSADSATPPPAHKVRRRHAAAQPVAPAAAPENIAPDQVHPITSLPRPQGADVAADTDHYVSPSHHPAAVPAAYPAPSSPAPLTAMPVSEESSSSSAVGAPAPAEPEGVRTPSAPPMADPAPVPPVPLAMRASVGLPAAAQALPAGGGSVDHMRPFSAVGVQIKAGFAGPGFDIAVPLAQHWNARVGGSFFQYSGTYSIDGIDISGEVKFRSANFSLDYYPFRGSFRISPGVTFYNGNNIKASAQIPGGNTFTLNDVNYTSSPTDPVRGAASMTFGQRQAPSITAGWGNMIPRHGSRFSVPFEFGIQYISDPKINMTLAGTACSTQGTVSGCGQLQSDPIAQDNLAKELKKVNDQIHPLAYYPILSIGVSWSFAHRNR